MQLLSQRAYYIIRIKLSNHLMRPKSYLNSDLYIYQYKILVLSYESFNENTASKIQNMLPDYLLQCYVKFGGVIKLPHL